MSAPRYAELQVTSHFSFLRGASSPEELFATAALMGIEALAVADRNTLAGMVRAHEAAKATGVRLIVGCRLDLACGMSLLVYPTDREAYSRLCRLLTLGKGRAGKGRCHLEWSDLVAYGEGLVAVLLPDLADDECGLRLRRMRDAFGTRAYLALSLRRRPNDQMRLWDLSMLAQRFGVPTIVPSWRCDVDPFPSAGNSTCSGRSPATSRHETRRISWPIPSSPSPSRSALRPSTSPPAM